MYVFISLLITPAYFTQTNPKKIEINVNISLDNTANKLTLNLKKSISSL